MRESCREALNQFGSHPTFHQMTEFKDLKKCVKSQLGLQGSQDTVTKHMEVCPRLKKVTLHLNLKKHQPVKNLPKWLAASTTALYPAMLAIELSASNT